MNLSAKHHRSPLPATFSGKRIWECWEHLPLWLNVFTMLFSCYLSMRFFSPSRAQYLLTSLFPLFWIALYFLAWYSCDQSISHPLGKTIVSTLVLVCMIMMIGFFIKPQQETEIITTVDTYYFGARVDKDGMILDFRGNPVFDLDGIPLEQNSVVVTADGRSLKVEGKYFIDVSLKRQLVTGLEIGNGLFALVLVLHCWYFRGTKDLIIFFGAALLYGFLLESGGVSLDYFRERDYHIYLPFLAAPLATMAGWSVIFYSAVNLYEMLLRRWTFLSKLPILMTGSILSLIALFRDLNIDPTATGLAFWTWHESLPDWFLGVPFINFSSWFSAVFTFGIAYVGIQKKTEWKGKKQIAAMFLSIPVCLFLAAIVNFTLLGFVEGWDGPSWKILTQSIFNILNRLVQAEDNPVLQYGSVMRAFP